MIGFKMDEVMTGHHVFNEDFSIITDMKDLPKGNLFMEFKITWGPDDILTWLNPFSGSFMTQPLSGVITIEGLCENCPCDGTLTLAYHKGEIYYNIRFFHERRVYRYVGKKTNIKLWNLPFSHTICRGKLTVRTLFRDWEISDSTLYFKFSTMVDFLKSFRFVKND